MNGCLYNYSQDCQDHNHPHCGCSLQLHNREVHVHQIGPQALVCSGMMGCAEQLSRPSRCDAHLKHCQAKQQGSCKPDKHVCLYGTVLCADTKPGCSTGKNSSDMQCHVCEIECSMLWPVDVLHSSGFCWLPEGKAKASLHITNSNVMRQTVDSVHSVTPDACL